MYGVGVNCTYWGDCFISYVIILSLSCTPQTTVTLYFRCNWKTTVTAFFISASVPLCTHNPPPRDLRPVRLLAGALIKRHEKLYFTMIRARWRSSQHALPGVALAGGGRSWFRGAEGCRLPRRWRWPGALALALASWRVPAISRRAVTTPPFHKWPYLTRGCS